jgi:hypothetical protein
MASSSSKARKPRRKMHPNWYVLTREERQRGYRNALMSCVKHSWERYGWFYRHIRGWYRAKKRRG